jgi:hypothetical protein
MSKKLTSLLVLACVLVICGCDGSTPGPAAGGGKADEIARAASAGVGTLTQSGAGGAGSPVIALEERHNSRVGQLQHAVTLVRLHDKYGLKDIVLEGYLVGRPEINTDWFARAGGKTPEARARVAVQFLRQGEISAAEFIKLVYPEVALHQAETADNYNVEPPAGLDKAILEYLNGIAAVDRSWAEEKSKPYQDAATFESLSGDEKLRMAKEIKKYAEDKSVYVSAGSKRAMEGYINFMERRLASNQTMGDVSARVGGGAQQVIAVNIGADHSQGMGQLFKDANRPYAVVKPLYTPGNPERGDLTEAMYNNKNHRLPVFSVGLSALVQQEVGGAKKPEPVLSENWFQAEGELYGFVTTIAEAVLASPAGGGKPPYGLSDADFDGKWIKIAPAKVQLLPSQGGKGGVALIPVVFKPSRDTVWVGSVLKRGQEQGQETVEAIVTHALQSVQAESRTPERAEDASGRVQMSLDVFSVVGRDENTVRQAALSEA